MKVLRRLGWFGVGAVLGTILVVFFFGDRDMEWSYLPTDRVLTDISRKHWFFNEEVTAQNECMHADSAFYAKVFSESEVDFSFNERGTTQACKDYKLLFTNEQGVHTFIVKNCNDTTATVTNWVFPEGVTCE